MVMKVTTATNKTIRVLRDIGLDLSRLWVREKTRRHLAGVCSAGPCQLEAGRHHAAPPFGLVDRCLVRGWLTGGKLGKDRVLGRSERYTGHGIRR